MEWPVPEHLTGYPDYLRVFAGATKEAERECPLHRAIKARPNLQVADAPRFKQPFELFALKPVMDALDRREFPGDPPPTWAKPVHPGLAQWARRAVAGYLEAARELDPHGTLLPVACEWVYQHRQPAAGDRDKVTDMCAWGRRYESADGRLRELRLLRFGKIEPDDKKDPQEAREEGQVELAAYVVAFGRPAYQRGFRLPYLFYDRPQHVERVRIVEIGCMGGPPNVLFDDTVDATVEPYRKLAAPRLRATIDATERIACASCAKCPLAPTCPKLPRTPGVLGVSDIKVTRRSVSMTGLRSHHRCAAQQHLRELHLPHDWITEYGADEHRGQAVHAYIAKLHARGTGKPCTAQDAPSEPEWQIDEWQVTGEQARLANQLIARHAAVCPLHYADTATVRPEEMIAAYDTDCETIVLSTPDVLYTDDGSPVWRETKTTKSLASSPSADVLDLYPQAALALLLIAGGALGPEISQSRVEVEILRSTGSDLEIISPHEPERLAKAREVIASYARPWHADSLLATAPGKECRRCSVATWCVDRVTDQSQTAQCPGVAA